jgi:hypothetical protein
MTFKQAQVPDSNALFLISIVTVLGLQISEASLSYIRGFIYGIGFVQRYGSIVS